MSRDSFPAEQDSTTVEHWDCTSSIEAVAVADYLFQPEHSTMILTRYCRHCSSVDCYFDSDCNNLYWLDNCILQGDSSHRMMQPLVDDAERNVDELDDGEEKDKYRRCFD